MKTKQYIFIIATAVFTVSCKKDKENPVIIMNIPEEHSEHTWGSLVHIEATFTDDLEFKQYDIFMGDEDGNYDTDIDFMRSGDVQGISYDFHDRFIVPDSVGTVSYIHIEVEDNEGKISNLKWMIHFLE